MSSSTSDLGDKRRHALPKRRVRWFCLCFCATVSALLLIAWPLSYFRSFEVNFSNGMTDGTDHFPQQECVLATRRGLLSCEYWHSQPGRPPATEPVLTPSFKITSGSYGETYHRMGNRLPWYGFQANHGPTLRMKVIAGPWMQTMGFGPNTELVFPFFMPVAIFLTTSYILARPIMRDRRRLRRGECLTCGYNLTASPTRCPECGTPVPQPPPTPAPQ